MLKQNNEESFFTKVKNKIFVFYNSNKKLVHIGLLVIGYVIYRKIKQHSEIEMLKLLEEEAKTKLKDNLKDIAILDVPKVPSGAVTDVVVDTAKNVLMANIVGAEPSKLTDTVNEIAKDCIEDGKAYLVDAVLSIATRGTKA